ncbi:MAG: HlyD family type I secretion periplasmic adaptor subunit [Alphaproteobacteria bacterium]|nr:HlyD family type I secretion periplasmic adaptor subunit [Alphaproteobacteria bacterium]
MPLPNAGSRRPNLRSNAPSLPTDTKRTIIVGVSLIALTFGGFGIWSTTVPIASAVVATGQLVVASKRKQIQHLTGGVVRSLRVEDGSKVKEGDILVELEDDDASERLIRTRDTYYLALAAAARLNAESEDRAAPEYPDELTKAGKSDPAIASIVAGQSHLFEARRLELRGQLSIMEDEHTQLKSQLVGIEAERRSALAQASMTRKELAVVEDLYAKGYTTRTRVYSLNRDIEQLTGSAGRLTADSSRVKTAILEAELKIAQVRNQLQSTIQNELHETQAKIPNLRQQFLAASTASDRMILRAPVAGTVVSSKVHTVGAVVAPGDTVMEIVPAGDRLMVEVMLRPTDVDSVKVGLSTEIRFTGLVHQRSVPLLTGQVTRVSADAIQDPRTSATFFIAQIDVPASEIRRLGKRVLQPGMPASVMIKTGERTALAYLTQPLTESVASAWREQ